MCHPGTCDSLSCIGAPDYISEAGVACAAAVSVHCSGAFSRSSLVVGGLTRGSPLSDHIRTPQTGHNQTQLLVAPSLSGRSVFTWV